MANVRTRLYRLFGGMCHYCGEKTNRKIGSRQQATIEHVVPRAFGGANDISNYVLACSACNGERGSQLFYCSCVFCGPLIEAAIKSDEFINGMFKKIIKHNTPRVYKNGEGVWCVGLHHGRTHHETWEAAMEHAYSLGKVEA